jgi:ABC-type Fe3+-hydroxamate transport system substrate-binding protein
MPTQPRYAPWAALLGALLLAPHLAAAAPWSARDDDGRLLALSAPAKRIVSLSPGATALLFAAGAGAQIVGTSEYSTEPAAARDIPRVGDSQSFDTERILSLHPDVVIAWVDGTPEAQIARIERLGIPVYRHHVQRLDDLASAIRRLGAPWSARDDDGRLLALSAPAKRIVSLSPGATALLFAAAAGSGRWPARRRSRRSAPRRSSSSCGRSGRAFMPSTRRAS